MKLFVLFVMLFSANHPFAQKLRRSFVAKPPPVTMVKESFDHSAWDRILKEHVVLVNDAKASRVDYAKLQNNHIQLTEYLGKLSGVTKEEFAAWHESEKLAFLINAYNAFTLELVLTKYPNLKSIKDIGSVFSSPWKKKFIRLFGDTVYLDYIEHEIIRKDFNEPRIHFAVNCASISCPMLLNEAFRGPLLDAQLEKATVAFMSDNSRNRYNDKTKRLEVSKIFDWYSEDFKKGNLGIYSVEEFMAKYVEVLSSNKDVQNKIKNKLVTIDYLEYDWGLNKK